MHGAHNGTGASMCVMCMEQMSILFETEIYSK